MTAKRTGALAIVAFGGVLIWANWPISALPEGATVDHVVVKKSARVLELYKGAELVRSYSVSLGRRPIGPKERTGDGRTPEGNYRLDYRKLESSFHRALHISYPDSKDVAAARAKALDAGGLIMVHGMKNGLGWIGRAHRAFDWTDGCVAVTDREIEEIIRVVPDGTPITILP
jgi:murein L,D-transpeptidase YafK